MRNSRIFVILVMVLLVLSGCSEDRMMPQEYDAPDLGVTEEVQMVRSAYYPTDMQKIQREVSLVKTVETSTSGCIVYPFMNGDYSIYNEYQGIIFSDPTGINTGWVQIEDGSTIYWAPVMVELPDLAGSISMELLDGETYEEWFEGSGYFRTIGTNVKFYNEDMLLLGEIETETNSDWQLYSFEAPQGEMIKHMLMSPKYKEEIIPGLFYFPRDAAEVNPFEQFFAIYLSDNESYYNHSGGFIDFNTPIEGGIILYDLTNPNGWPNTILFNADKIYGNSDVTQLFSCTIPEYTYNTQIVEYGPTYDLSIQSIQLTGSAPDWKMAVSYNRGIRPKMPESPFMRWKNWTVCYVPPCTPPEVDAYVSNAVLWPPNNKAVAVEFSGLIVNDSETGTTTYNLADEYGEIAYTGELPAGEYLLSLDLTAARKGSDKDGRVYTFSVFTVNEAGEAEASVEVLVPHNIGKK